LPYFLPLPFFFDLFLLEDFCFDSGRADPLLAKDGLAVMVRTTGAAYPTFLMKSRLVLIC
jgi:hypothetical protein